MINLYKHTFRTMKQLPTNTLSKQIWRYWIFSIKKTKSTIKNFLPPFRKKNLWGFCNPNTWGVRSKSDTLSWVCARPSGALALLHPPPGGLSKWPGLLLSLCLACESRDRRLLQQVGVRGGNMVGLGWVGGVGGHGGWGTWLPWKFWFFG